MTETPDNRGEIGQVRRLLEEYGIRGDALAVRPLIRRGFAASLTEAGEFDCAAVAPELTVTADGIHWHPLGGDLESSPDMLVAPGRVPLAEGKRLITERFLHLRQADGSLPVAFRCAV